MDHRAAGPPAAGVDIDPHDGRIVGPLHLLHPREQRVDVGCRDAVDLDVNIFEHFPGNEKILTQVITPNGQTGGELTRDTARLMLP